MMVRRFEHEIPFGARPIFRGYVKLQECIVKTWNLFVTLYFGDSTQPSKKKAVAFGNEKTQWAKTIWETQVNIYIYTTSVTRDPTSNPQMMWFLILQERREKLLERQAYAAMAMEAIGQSPVIAAQRRSRLGGWGWVGCKMDRKTTKSSWSK